LETDLDRQKLAMMTREVGLSDVFGVALEILSGQVRGRVVVKVG
jgi:acrylyl-CoA reductase (NADPH)